ncbi:hypothetical protein MCC93_24770 [Morococcus cerebrosus]|uniref:Uncharacterized protein n=1 Tax=Morococcus cerebrosus TaxID=1056807 RepID=A0A0C1GKS4_9NEIS|nr:hypothetical protein MCC93_24770 [Morococcus cerebrosus]
MNNRAGCGLRYQKRSFEKRKMAFQTTFALFLKAYSMF